MATSIVIVDNFIAEPSIGRLFYHFEPTQAQAEELELGVLRGSKREAFIHFGRSGRNIPFSVKELRDIKLSNWRSELLYSVDSIPQILDGSYWYDEQDKKWNYVPELGLLDVEKASKYWYDEQANLYYYDDDDDGTLVEPHPSESEKLKQQKVSREEIDETLKRRRDFIYGKV